MIHLPKKRPWLILLGIYLVIMLVWGTFYFLADQAGDQVVDPQEAEELLKNSPSSKHKQPSETNDD